MARPEAQLRCLRQPVCGPTWWAWVQLLDPLLDPRHDAEVECALDDVKLHQDPLELRVDVGCDLSAKVADSDKSTRHHSQERTHEEGQDRHVPHRPNATEPGPCCLIAENSFRPASLINSCTSFRLLASRVREKPGMNLKKGMNQDERMN
jgi:hypothetical protein